MRKSLLASAVILLVAAAPAAATSGNQARTTALRDVHSVAASVSASSRSKVTGELVACHRVDRAYVNCAVKLDFGTEYGAYNVLHIRGDKGRYLGPWTFNLRLPGWGT
ncbi:MAG TPA: hypothetical protein VGI67_15180 [Thermoleophilaceae bacterium]|jgi:hypothetical protein